VITPILNDLPPANPLATGFGTNPKVRIAAATAVAFSGLTLAVPFRMRDTVLGETPALCATISMFTGPLVVVEFDFVGSELFIYPELREKLRLFTAEMDSAKQLIA
jgi:hypothetical protein